MNIEQAVVSQSEALADIIRDANKNVALEFGINHDNNPKHPSFCTVGWVRSDFERGEQYFLLKHNAYNVACVAYENPRPGVAYLNRLSVLPKYR